MQAGARTRRAGVLMVVPALAVTVLLAGGAIVGAGYASVTILGEATLAAWRDVLASPDLRAALGLSVRVTVVTTLAAALLAIVAAAGLRRTTVARSLATLPIFVPPLLAAALAVVWLGPGGIAERLIGGLPVPVVRDRAGYGIVLVYLWKEVPFLTLLVLAAWTRSVDERVEAAATLGASASQRLRWVVWPAIRPALVIGATIAGAFVFGAFEVPLVVGPNHPPMIATLALEQTRTADLAGQARAAATLLLASGVTVTLGLLGFRAWRSPRG